MRRTSRSRRSAPRSGTWLVRRAACLAARDRSVSFVRPISDSSDSLTRVSTDRKETRRGPRGNEGKSRTVQGRDRSVSLRDICIDPRLSFKILGRGIYGRKKKKSSLFNLSLYMYGSRFMRASLAGQPRALGMRFTLARLWLTVLATMARNAAR